MAADFAELAGRTGGMGLVADAVRRGVVVLVRLPRDKARPAVVVRSDLLSELSYATVLPITTDLRPDVSLRIDLVPSEQNGLQMASQVMVDWLQTIRFSEMGQVIGRLRDGAPGCIIGKSLVRQRTLCPPAVGKA